MDVGYDRDEIRTAIEKQASKGLLDSDTLYGDGKSGPRIAELLTVTELGIDKRLNY